MTTNHPIRVKALDHIVLTVRNTEQALEFYTGTLGLTPEHVAAWRAGQVRFPSVRINQSTIIDLVERDSTPEGHPAGHPNMDHFCLTVQPLDWQQVIDSGTLKVLHGPITRSGARGQGQSVYLEDPDGNTIELRWYPHDLDQPSACGA